MLYINFRYKGGFVGILMGEDVSLKRTKRSRDGGRPISLRQADMSEEEKGDNDSSPSFAFRDRCVRINVGGICITTMACTLCSEPSRLSEWVKNNFAGLPRDSKGNPFIDRDPENFRRILNYLRGYDLPLSTDKIAFLADDADFYRIDGLRALIDPPPQWRFESGPGVSQDKTMFSTENILGICGSEPLPPVGTSVFVLRVDKCELVSIGLIGTDSPLENEALQGQPHSIAYCNTGELVRCVDMQKTYVSGMGFKSHDVVTVRVEFTQGSGAKIVFLCGPVKTYETEWPEPTPPLRFAVSLHGTSAVTLERCVVGDTGGGGGWGDERGALSEFVALQ